MQPNHDIEILTKAGIQPPVAEVLANTVDSFLARPYDFDDEYWVWRLAKVGLKEDTARGYLMLLRKPSLARSEFPDYSPSHHEQQPS